jgi:two-component system, sensor histidine kinase and response regulator
MTEEKPIVLIADDEPLNTRVLHDLLCDEYRVIVASNGPQALQLAQQLPLPDIILLDIQMPGMTGHEVCKELKSIPLTRDIPIMFLTALAAEEDEKTGLALGAVDYISKPLRPTIVLARIRTHLRLKRTRQALSERNKELERMLHLRETVEEISRHDLKTPLAGMLGVTQLLLHEDYLQNEHRELLEMQRAAGYKMIEMINRSMDMLKMEMGTYELNLQPVDLCRIVRRIMSELNHPHFIRLVDGSPMRDDDTFLLLGEELLFYSMLSNLIKNAVEAGCRTDQVSVELRHRPDGFAIHIQNPKPVPMAIRPHFFDKYTTAGKRTGTGLGTYSAKLISRVLGGTISMTTSDDDGTCVTIHLPALDATTAQTALEAYARPPSYRPESSFAQAGSRYGS